MYELTPQGREEAAAWFTMPLDPTVPARDQVTTKLLLAMLAGLVEPGEVVQAQRVVALAARQHYTGLKAEAEDSEAAWLLHLEGLVMQAEAELRWLDPVEDRLAVAKA